MRHSFHFSIIAFAVAAMLAGSCGESPKPLDNPQEKPEEKPEVKVDGSSVAALIQNSIPADSKEAEKVTFTANAAWNTVISQGVKSDTSTDWISVSPDHGDAGTYTLTISMDENTGPESRSATIKIVCGDSSTEISITQNGAEVNGIFGQWLIVGMDQDTGATGQIELFEKSTADGCDVNEKILFTDDSGSWIFNTTRDYYFVSGNADEGVIRYDKIDARGRDRGMTCTFSIAGDKMTLITAGNDGSWSNTLQLERVTPPVEYMPVDYSGGCEAVDLGLSVKWASFNLGATKPEEYGSYFAWGETVEKDYYYWDKAGVYKWGDYDPGSAPLFGMTKYHGKAEGGDGLCVLKPEDDPATANWGLRWHTPTSEEVNELLTLCEWTWDDTEKGFFVKSPKTGKTIFLPAAGACFVEHVPSNNEVGYYWTSSVNETEPQSAYGFNFAKWNNEHILNSAPSRYTGQSVRAVTAY